MSADNVQTPTLGEPDETLPDIVAWIHRHANVYGHDLAERIDRASVKEHEIWRQNVADAAKNARKDDERLMLSLMLYAVEDFVEDWANARYKQIVTDACERLGIEYRPDAQTLQGQIEDRIKGLDGVDGSHMTGIDKDIFNTTRTLTSLLNDACNHWNYLCPYLEQLARAANAALRGYQKDYPAQVAELIDYKRREAAK